LRSGSVVLERARLGKRRLRSNTLCTAKMASGLRHELRQALTALQTEILADSSRTLDTHRARAHLAELSSVRALLALCLEALTGETLEADGDFMTTGQVKDCQDAASLGARELRILREEVESQLARAPNLPRECREMLQAVLTSEQSATLALEAAVKTHAETMERALGVCSREMCDVLCRALERAAPTGTTYEQRHGIARAAERQVCDIVGCWLHWFVASEPRKGQALAVHLPPEMTLLCLQDGGVAEYLRLLRRCMHLRRQHARMVAVMRRLAAAVGVCDVCTLLRAKIVFGAPGAART
jgi:hypothetical protein